MVNGQWQIAIRQQQQQQQPKSDRIETIQNGTAKQINLRRYENKRERERDRKRDREIEKQRVQFQL